MVCVVAFLVLTLTVDLRGRKKVLSRNLRYRILFLIIVDCCLNQE